jgi:WD40 repeat protein
MSKIPPSSSFSASLLPSSECVESPHLPEDMLIQIFTRLPLMNVMRASLVSRHWRKSIFSDSLLSLSNIHIWKSFVSGYFPHIRLNSQSTDYQALFKGCIDLERMIKNGAYSKISLLGEENSKISCAEISQKLLCLGLTSGEVSLCDAETKEEWARLQGPVGPSDHSIESITIKHNYLCAKRVDHTLSVWELGAEKELPIFLMDRERAFNFQITDQGLLCVESHPLVAGGERVQIDVWNLKEKRHLHTLDYHPSISEDNSRLWPLLFRLESVDNSLYIYHGGDGGKGEVTAWDLTNNACIYGTPHTRDQVASFMATGDSLVICTQAYSERGNTRGRIRVLDRHTGTELSKKTTECIANAHIQGSNLYVTFPSNVHIRDLMTMDVLGSYSSPESTSLSYFRVDVQDNIFVTGSKDGTITVWEKGREKKLHELPNKQPTPPRQLKIHDKRIYASGKGWFSVWEIQERPA